MLTAAENDFLCNTDTGTPMGNLIRRFWIPAVLSEELPEPDSEPVRVTLLGEKLIAFREKCLATCQPTCNAQPTPQACSSGRLLDGDDAPSEFCD